MDGKDSTPPTDPGRDTGADDAADRIEPANDSISDSVDSDSSDSAARDASSVEPDEAVSDDKTVDSASGDADDVEASDHVKSTKDDVSVPPPNVESEPGDPYGGTPPWLRQGSARRSLVGVGLTLALVIGVAAVGWFLFQPADTPAEANENEPSGTCDVVESDDGGLLIAPPTLGQTDPRLTATIVTNHGEITVLLFGDIAPCGVSGFDYLSKQGFYNGSSCYRLSTQPTDPTVVLRCGDPTGTGDGGPGYRFRAEQKFIDSPIFDAFALINDSSGRAGSNFAFVRGQSLPTASVSVIGQVIDGFDVLDRIGGAGLDPYDGVPIADVSILSVTIAQGTVTLPPTSLPSGSPSPSGSGVPGLPTGPGLPTSQGPGDGSDTGSPSSEAPGPPGRST